MKKILLSVMALSLCSCASINSVSLTPIPADRRNAVKAESSRLIILGFNFDNDFVDSVTDDLRRQCPQGKVTGILTKDETYNYFLFVWKKKITTTGYCLSAKSGTAKSSGGRSTASEGEIWE